MKDREEYKQTKQSVEMKSKESEEEETNTFEGDCGKQPGVYLLTSLIAALLSFHLPLHPLSVNIGLSLTVLSVFQLSRLPTQTPHLHCFP